MLLKKLHNFALLHIIKDYLRPSINTSIDKSVDIRSINTGESP